VFTAVAGGSLGLLAGGVLTEALSWHWIFFVNVPIGVATFLAGRILIPADSGTGAAGGIDWLGATLVTIALMSGVYAIVSATSHGWASANVLGFGAASVVLMGAFLLVEARSSHPIMPLRILRVPGLISSSIVRGFLVTGMYSTFFLGTLYLEHVLHYSALQAGAAFLPWTLSVAALSMGMTARLVERFGPMRVLLTGMAAVVLGLGMLQGTGAESHYLPLMCMSFLLIGLGIGSAFMPLLGIAMADVPPADAGLGSGIVNVSQQVAGALGLAVLTTVATNRTHALAGHERAVGALLGGYHLAYAVGAVSVAVGAVVAAALLRRPTPPVEPEVETQAEVSFFDEPVYAEMEHAEYAGV
jgi:MFS family permease